MTSHLLWYVARGGDIILGRKTKNGGLQLLVKREDGTVRTVSPDGVDGAVQMGTKVSQAAAHMAIIGQRAAALMGLSWPEVARWAGWAKKRLCLQSHDWRQIALAGICLPYVMKESRSAVPIARYRIDQYLRRKRDPEVHQFMWLAGLKIPVSTLFERPKGLSFKVKTLNDYYWAWILDSLHTSAELFGTSAGTEFGIRWILRHQHERAKYPIRSKNDAIILVDSFQMTNSLRRAGVNIPPVANPNDWSQQIHDLWLANLPRIAALEEEEWTLPGENFIPQLEGERIKLSSELQEAGEELHHCVGMYARYDHLAHYRRGTVVAQVDISERTLVQCYDACNQRTEESEAYASLIRSLIGG